MIIWKIIKYYLRWLTKKDFDNLYFILRSIIKNKELNNDVNKYNNKNLYKTHKNLVVLKYVEENIGKNSNYNIYLYPPGTPFIIKDELITEEIVDKLKQIDIDKNIEIIFWFILFSLFYKNFQAFCWQFLIFILQYSAVYR